jgi:hypothetical protein
MGAGAGAEGIFGSFGEETGAFNSPGFVGKGVAGTGWAVVGIVEVEVVIAGAAGVGAISVPRGLAC